MLLGNLKYLKIGRFTLEKETVRISLSTPAGAAKDERGDLGAKGLGSDDLLRGVVQLARQGFHFFLNNILLPNSFIYLFLKILVRSS
jgi:hypothetical protein